MKNKKLIEVALPLKAINEEAVREKSIRHGHPSTLHLWWARRPLAACRAVLFASLVDDPSSHPEKFPTEEAQETELQRLFALIERLVKWENTQDEGLYADAYKEICASTGGKPPPVLDPFAGGGSIPLEAQRLGLESHASDLNPVAVLINKALIEIPPKFAGRPPVNPDAQENVDNSSARKGTAGLACDVQYYGEWMRKKAFERIGHLYPKVRIHDEGGDGAREATVIAWLWSRTVKCPNPACGAEMPLVRSFEISKKKGKGAWVNPKIDGNRKSYQFEVRHGKGDVPDGTVNRNGARCICCDTPVALQYIRDEGKAGRMNAKLMAIVAEGPGGRIYLSPDEVHIQAADVPMPKDYPDGKIIGKSAVSVPLYGMIQYADLFTPRQLTALVTFSNLVNEAIAEVEKDAKKSTDYEDDRGLDDGGTGTKAYAEAVGVYLGMIVSKLTDYHNSLCSWHSSGEKMRNLFARQAVPMVWDFAEADMFCFSSGSWNNFVEWVCKCIVCFNPHTQGCVTQQDATKISIDTPIVISTDPPYYDNIGYADLSDFFYIWLRYSLYKVYPKLFSTMLVPKVQELVATAYRFDGNRETAKSFFETGMQKAFKRMRETVSQDYPLTVYYAYKQTGNSEAEETMHTETSSSGWETMLQAIINAGFSITGTWPLRTEMMSRAVAMNANALASSIAIVCRPRPADAPSTTRRAFQAELREAIKVGLRNLQSGNIAPVDFAQASIGPGIAVYSKYKEIVEASGENLTVRQALVMINQELDAFLCEQSGHLDGESQFCVSWFEQHRFEEGAYGDANTFLRARMADEKKLTDSGMLEAKQGKVRLKRWDELKDGHHPKTDDMIWEIVQHLCHILETSEGIDRSASVMAKFQADVLERVKILAYRIYQICDRKGWTDEALTYNNLVAMWGILDGKTREIKQRTPVQGNLDLEG